MSVLIPVKSTGMKSRLSGLLSGTQRGEFTRLLLSDVLGVIRQAGLLDACFVVSADGGVLELAGGLGAHRIREQADSGVNAAVVTGMRAAGSTKAVLVLPSDLPLLRASEIRHLLGLESSGLDVVLAPSAGFDGTNALMFQTASKLPLSYDRNSFWNHLSAAARLGLSVGVCSAPGLMFDVDSHDDFRVLARTTVDSQSAAFARRVLG